MPDSTKVDELRRDCTLRFNGRVEGEMWRWIGTSEYKEDTERFLISSFWLSTKNTKGV